MSTLAQKIEDLIDAGWNAQDLDWCAKWSSRVYFFASSAESMGRFWFGKSSWRVIEGDFHRFIGPKTVGSSDHHSNFFVEAFDRPSRNLCFGAEPVQQ